MYYIFFSCKRAHYVDHVFFFAKAPPTWYARLIRPVWTRNGKKKLIKCPTSLLLWNNIMGTLFKEIYKKRKIITANRNS